MNRPSSTFNNVLDYHYPSFSSFTNAIGAGYTVVDTWKAAVTKSIPPGAKGKLEIQTRKYTESPRYDCIAITAKDPAGKQLWTWVWPNMNVGYKPNFAGGTKTSAAETSDALTATAGGLSLQFDKKTGLLSSASRAGKTFSFLNGPRFLSAGAAAG